MITIAFPLTITIITAILFLVHPGNVDFTIGALTGVWVTCIAVWLLKKPEG